MSSMHRALYPHTTEARGFSGCQAHTGCCAHMLLCLVGSVGVRHGKDIVITCSHRTAYLRLSQERVRT